MAQLVFIANSILLAFNCIGANKAIMNGWFRNRPTKRVIIDLRIFRDTGLSNYLLLGLCVLLNSSCYAQDKPTGNFKIISNNHTTLSIKTFTGNTMMLKYQTLPGNQAGQNHNSLWLWRASEVPWTTPPMKMQPLPANATESGSYVLDSISIMVNTAYIACYSLDTTAQQICACAQLSATSDSSTNEWVNLSLLGVSGNAVVFQYETLTGYLPADYNNWFGIWQGSASPYNYFPPLAIGKPLDNSNINTAALNNLSLEYNQVYTLMYFVGKDSTAAAATITFRVQ